MVSSPPAGDSNFGCGCGGGGGHQWGQSWRDRPPPAARPPPAQLCVVATQGHCVVATGLGNPKSRISGEGFPEGRAAWSRRAWKSQKSDFWGGFPRRARRLVTKGLEKPPPPPWDPCFWAKNDPKIKNVTKWVAVAPFGELLAHKFPDGSSGAIGTPPGPKTGNFFFLLASWGPLGPPW